jgi:hypothetical protein
MNLKKLEEPESKGVITQGPNCKSSHWPWLKQFEQQNK